MTTVAIYTRVSHEDLEVPASTRRQEYLCRQYANSRGWEVAGVWEDVDLSAYQRDVRRPAFNEVTRVASGGRVDGVLVWKLDRLVRRPSDFERFWIRCENAGVFLASATEPIDSTTEMGLAVIRILVNFANVESTSFSLRMKARLAEKARSGVKLGNARTFGYTDDGRALITEEADLVREAADRVLAGDTVKDIASDWRRRNVLTARGKPWPSYSLAKLLSSPMLVGDNTYHGDVVAKDAFPPVLDRLVAARVRAVMADRMRIHGPNHHHLLSGLLRCSMCGGRLYGAWDTRHLASGEVVKIETYKCHCAKVMIKGAFVESLIVSAVLYRLEERAKISPTVDPPPGSPAQLTAAYERYANSLRDLASDYYVAHRVTKEEWITARNGLERQLHTARREFDPSWKLPPARRAPSAVRFRSQWESLDMAHRRDIIASELEYAAVKPPSRRGVVDLSRIDAKWWDDEAELEASLSVAARKVDLDIWDWDRWISATDVVRATGLSNQVLHELVATGDLQAVPVGRHLRYLRADVGKLAAALQGTITAEEAASQLGVTRGYVYQAIRDGRLPSVRLGRCHYLQPAAVESLDRALGLTRLDLIPTDEARARLGVSQGTLLRMIRSGKLRHLRRGNHFRVYREDVAQLAASMDEARNDPARVEVLSTPQVARRFGVSVGTVGRMVQEGFLPATSVGGRYEIREADAIAVMADWRSRSTTPGSKPPGFLTAQQVAEALDVAPRVVIYSARTGRLPFVERRRHLFFRPADIEVWARSLGMGEDVIGPSEAWRVLGVPRRHGVSMIESGELPAIKRGRRTHLRRDDVLALAAKLRAERAADDSVGTREAARLLGTSPATVWGLIHDGHLPAVLMRNRYKVRRDDLVHAADVLRSRPQHDVQSATRSRSPRGRRRAPTRQSAQVAAR